MFLSCLYGVCHEFHPLLQAPMADSWDNITVGMKVEVQNTDCDNFSEDFPDSFWVATVLKIQGVYCRDACRLFAIYYIPSISTLYTYVHLYLSYRL